MRLKTRTITIEKKQARGERAKTLRIIALFQNNAITFVIALAHSKSERAVAIYQIYRFCTQCDLCGKITPDCHGANKFASRNDRLETEQHESTRATVRDKQKNQKNKS